MVDPIVAGNKFNGLESERNQLKQKSEILRGENESFDPKRDKRALDRSPNCPATRHKEAGSSFAAKPKPPNFVFFVIVSPRIAD